MVLGAQHAGGGSPRASSLSFAICEEHLGHWAFTTSQLTTFVASIRGVFGSDCNFDFMRRFQAVQHVYTRLKLVLQVTERN